MKGNKYKMKFFLRNIIFLMLIIFPFPEILVAQGESQQKNASEHIEGKKETIHESLASKLSNLDIDSFISLFGIIFTVTMSTLAIIFQLGRQHKNNIELERENNKEKLKLEIYSNYREKISEAQRTTAYAYSEAWKIYFNYKIYVGEIQRGNPIKPISERIKDLQDAHYAAGVSIRNLIRAIEEYEIINPNLEIFRVAFAYAMDCMDKAFLPFHAELLKFLPIDVPLQDQARVGSNIIVPRVASNDDLERISEREKEYSDATMEASCYISDLAKEAQNIFLGNLFSHHLPPRKPIDPKHIVISVEPQELSRLRVYFEETEWGKGQKEREKEIKKEIEEGKNSKNEDSS